MTEWLDSFVLGLVEGITEFIPVSSTGHLILAGHLLGFEGEKASTFEVVIQLGAILAVVFLYKERFFGLNPFNKEKGFAGINGLTLLFLTTLPALVFGAAAHGFIKSHLFNSKTVALGLGIGGVAILLVERFLPNVKRCGVDALSWREALSIGFFQCLALWPGISRSGATILGGMMIGVERKTAAEYSFLAAVPVMFAATAYDLYKSRSFLELSDLGMFSIGFVVSFITAWLTVKVFIRLLGRYTLDVFGWYRIAVALIILWLIR
ncbi:MAG: undecaprenyl-diphosphate phosphatase [Nitrospirae bacterium]|nr:undecaprenyl-diphosphate phosphatase [Nitrospirota bacterium]